MKTYLLDFDGTLVDSMPTFVSVMLRILDENHVAYGDDIIKIIPPLGHAGTAKYFVELGVPMSQEQVMEVMGRYIYEECLYNIPAKPNVADVLGQLRKQGCSRNILTASPRAVLDPCLKRLGLHRPFMCQQIPSKLIRAWFIRSEITALPLHIGPRSRRRSRIPSRPVGRPRHRGSGVG